MDVLDIIASLITIITVSIGTGLLLMCINQISNLHFNKKVQRLSIFVFSTILLYLDSRLIREIFQSLPVKELLVPLKIVAFLEFFGAGLMAFSVSMVILYVFNVPKKLLKLNKTIFVILLLIHTVLLVISLFNDWYYTVELTADNCPMLIQGDKFIISNFASLAMMLIDINLFIRHGRNREKRLIVAFWIYVLLPLLGIILKTFVTNLPFIIWATVGSTIYMFFVFITIQTEEFEKQQNAATRLDAELSTATRIQADMLPNVFPAFPNRNDFDIYASMEPAKEVGGDFYDFFLLDDDHLAMMIADVSGKGVPAALFMMSTMILLRNNTMLLKNPQDILMTTNKQICQNNQENMFVTVWLGILDLRTGQLRAANAGHEYPALKKPDGSFELIKDKHGMAVGCLETAKYKEYELTLEKGSKLFLYTDGVAEASDSADMLFGTDRMTAALKAHENDSPEKILQGIKDAINEFVKDAPQFDDITMMCLDYAGPQGAPV